MNLDKNSLVASAGCEVIEPIEDRLVDGNEFLELAVSTRKLIRMDDAEADLLGLLDPKLGVRFVTRRSPLGGLAVKSN